MVMSTGSVGPPGPNEPAWRHMAVTAPPVHIQPPVETGSMVRPVGRVNMSVMPESDTTRSVCLSR